MILVVGATGELGGAIARSLLEQGEPVRVLVRSGSSYDHLVEVGAHAVLGDLKDPASLRAACAGVDAVVTSANSIARGGADTAESVDRIGNQNLVEAAAAEGVARFVFVSALGASPDHPVPFLRAKGETEQALEHSGMAWTALQPNVFMDTSIPVVIAAPVLAGQPVTLVGEGRRRHSMVAMRDVAAYAVAALRHDAAIVQRLVIGGPEPISWRDVFAVFERRLGREIPVRTVAMGDPVPGMPGPVNQLFQSLETYDTPLDTSALAARYGISPTTVDDFVRDFLARQEARSV